MAPPVLVETVRGQILEAQHRGHVVQVGADGAVEAALGDPGALVPLRSCAKPFGLVAFVEAGAAEAFRVTAPELAIMAASHSGEDLYVRTIQGMLRRAGISQTLLGCGSDGAPLDQLTAIRLTRDGERPGPIRHMCSGQHASLLMLSKHAGWPLDDYWEAGHPSQVAFRLALARAFGVPPESMTTAVDSCGLLTYEFPLLEVARAFLLLADPAGVAADAQRRRLVPALTRIRDAMLAAPDLVGGSRERLDTALMKVSSGGFVAKGGAEALRGVAILSSVRGDRGAAGMALKIEDGDAGGRAAPAATVEALRQIGVLGAEALRRLAPYHHPPAHDPRGRVVGETRPRFELAPISELR
jgi:L-asparaginase II